MSSGVTGHVVLMDTITKRALFQSTQHKKMVLVFFGVVLFIWTANGCAIDCACSLKMSTINCANSHRTSVPDNLPSGYRTLILSHNAITELSKNDLLVITHFALVDLRNNPLNCSQKGLIHGQNIQTSCPLVHPSLEPGPISWTKTSTKSIDGTTISWTRATNTKPIAGIIPRVTTAKTKLTNNRHIWIISLTLVSLLIVIVGAVSGYIWHARKERVVRIEAIELENLTDETSDEEDTLFDTKEKRL